MHFVYKAEIYFETLQEIQNLNCQMVISLLDEINYNKISTSHIRCRYVDFP
jgi:hypothetical protein